jgi:hypothetical protein
MPFPNMFIGGILFFWMMGKLRMSIVMFWLMAIVISGWHTYGV